MARLVELIETKWSTGMGTDDDPIRFVKELWTKDGKCIVRYDPSIGKSVLRSDEGDRKLNDLCR